MKLFLRNIAYLTGILIFFSGCYLQSLYPLISPKKTEIIKGLDGRWETNEARWTFFRDSENLNKVNLSGLNFSGEIEFDFNEGDGLSKNDNSYFVIVEDLENPEVDSVLLVASIGKIDNQYYMDLTVPDIFKDVDFESFHLFPVHTFSKFTFKGDSLSLELFESKWISGLIKDNRVRIKHEIVGGDILITANTVELQKFVSKYGDDPKAFDGETNLIKVKSGQ